DSLPPQRQRAYWAQLNGFEAFPPFAAGVIVAHLAGASQSWIDALATTFVALRVIYTLAYIHDKPTERSLIWAAALACVVGLFVAAAAG
ncbi:MAG: MAPEG family protein, partial [Burkholderiales bacterium]